MTNSQEQLPFDSSNGPSEPRKLVWPVLAMMGVGLFLGAVFGGGVALLDKKRVLESMPWPDLTAMLLAVFLLGSGVATALMSLSRRGMAILSNPREPDLEGAVKTAEQTYFRLQAGVLCLAGALLATPLVWEWLDDSRRQGWPIYWGVVIAFLLQSGLNLAIWHRSDEVQKRVIAEAGAASFWLLQGALFLWACGEKMKLLPTATSWQEVVILMNIYVLVSVVIVYRKGIN